MIDMKAQLIVKHERSGVYNDYSHKTNNFGRDQFTVDLEVDNFFYVGFRKPINALYFNHVSAYELEGELSLEFYNGTSWVKAVGLGDDTLGLKRSGFVRFDREQVSQAPSLVDGSNQYWYRIKSSEERAALIVAGINIVFADDYELSLEIPVINEVDFLGTLPSHIMTHQAVRNEILQKLKNKDYYKIVDGVKEDLTAWDLLEIGEVRQAAVALALSKIYYQCSDGSNDPWKIKSEDYFECYQNFIQLASISLDTNNSGHADPSEIKQAFKNRFMSR